jgi:hypothetical protein
MVHEGGAHHERGALQLNPASGIAANLQHGKRAPTLRVDKMETRKRVEAFECFGWP